MNDKTTKTLLINSARTLFLEKGYENTPVEEICLLAGTAKGTFFYHFETKQYLVEYLLNAQLSDMIEYMTRPPDKKADMQSRLKDFILMLASGDGIPEAAGYFKKKPVWFHKLYENARYKYFFPCMTGILQSGQREYRIKNIDIVADLLYFGIDAYIYENHYRINSDEGFKKRAFEGIGELFSKTLGF